jgi:hypothetical protein
MNKCENFVTIANKNVIGITLSMEVLTVKTSWDRDWFSVNVRYRQSRNNQHFQIRYQHFYTWQDFLTNDQTIMTLIGLSRSQPTVEMSWQLGWDISIVGIHSWPREGMKKVWKITISRLTPVKTSWCQGQDSCPDLG